MRSFIMGATADRNLNILNARTALGPEYSQSAVMKIAKEAHEIAEQDRMPFDTALAIVKKHYARLNG